MEELVQYRLCKEQLLQKAVKRWAIINCQILNDFRTHYKYGIKHTFQILINIEGILENDKNDHRLYDHTYWKDQST